MMWAIAIIVTIIWAVRSMRSTQRDIAQREASYIEAITSMYRNGY